MIPSDYADRFKAEGSTNRALACVISDLYRETLKKAMERRGCGLLVEDLDQTEILFQAFRRKAVTFADGSPIPEKIFKIVLQQLAPDVFEKWNEHHNNKLLAD